MHGDFEEIEVVPEPGQQGAAAPPPNGKAAPTPAQKAAATRKRNAQTLKDTAGHVADVQKLSAEVDRCARKRKLWQGKEDKARQKLRDALGQWDAELKLWNEGGEQ
jgi:hypothetical protein